MFYTLAFQRCKIFEKSSILQKINRSIQKYGSIGLMDDGSSFTNQKSISSVSLKRPSYCFMRTISRELMRLMQGRNRQGAGWRFPRGPQPSAISRGPQHTVKIFFLIHIYKYRGTYSKILAPQTQSSTHFYTTRTHINIDTHTEGSQRHTHLKII